MSEKQNNQTINRFINTNSFLPSWGIPMRLTEQKGGPQSLYSNWLCFVKQAFIASALCVHSIGSNPVIDTLE